MNRTAADLPSSRPRPDSVEIAVLRLLATGATDETAARRLGMSVRSVRRRVAHVMGMLGATSRFEAGVRAAEQGWVGSTAPSTGRRQCARAGGGR